MRNINRLSSSTIILHSVGLAVLICIGVRLILFDIGMTIVRTVSNQDITDFERYINDIAAFDTFTLDKSWAYWLLCLVIIIFCLNILWTIYNENVSAIDNYERFFRYNSNNQMKEKEQIRIDSLERTINRSYDEYKKFVYNLMGYFLWGPIVYFVVITLARLIFSFFYHPQ